MMDMQIKYTRPVGSLTVDKRAVLRKTAEIVVDGMIQNVFDELTPKGAAQKRNTKATIEMKKAEGVVPPTRPLFGNEGLLVDRRTYLIRGDDQKVVIRLNAVRAEIVNKLQQRGYSHMGISQDAKDLIDIYVRQTILKALNELARKNLTVEFTS